MDWIFYIVGAIIVSFICASISDTISSNRGMAGGFWWGFFLWIIGIIVVAVRPSDQTKQSDALANTAHIFYCSACNQIFSGTIDKKIEICPKCGSVLLETSVLRKTWDSLSKENRQQMRRAFTQGQYLKGDHTQMIPPAVSAADEIEKFKGLLDRGVISQEEFDAKKKQLLGL